MEIPPLLILKPQPSQGGGADDARLVAQLRSGDGGDGSLPLAEAMGGYILPDRGQQGLPLTADAAPQQNHLRGQNIHKVRQSRRYIYGVPGHHLRSGGIALLGGIKGGTSGDLLHLSQQ